MEYAARLLQERKLPVSEAAQKSGYTNMSHFSKSFLKKYGVLPKDLGSHAGQGNLPPL
ncbi:MAG: helix-turn-helix domain-containing protein [Spirochaetaceae bacterium]|nr:helix-turn-helix domain-containing protein [Spirochaetaceae bacterium]